MNAVIAATGAVLLFAAASAGAQELTLGAAVDEALARHPAIVSAEAGTRAAAARTAEARATRLPRLEVTERIVRGNNPVFVFGSLLEQGVFAPRHFDPAFLNAPDALTNYRAALTASIPLFDRLQSRTAAAIGRNGEDVAGIALEDARQRLRAQTIAAYYGLVVAGEKLDVAQDAVRTAEADAKATRDRFEQGLLVESDALAAEVQLAAVRQRTIAAEGELATARAALAMLLRRPRADVTVAGTLPVHDGAFDDDLDDAIARAITHRAAVSIAASQTRDAQLRLSAQRNTALPRVDAFATLGASGSTFGRRNSDRTAGVAIALDVFDPGRQARAASARAAIDAARAEETIARDAVTMEVIAAWHRLRTARASAGVAGTAVGQAEAAARILRDRYLQGVATLTDHLRAQSTLTTVRFELLAARYESLVARAELLRATGDLDDVHPFL